MRVNSFVATLAALTFMAWAATPGYGDVIAPDNGTGTADLPLQLDFVPETPDSMWIINGLPPETTIKIDPVIRPPTSSAEAPGGALGGTVATGDVDVYMYLEGTGDLDGYKRTFIVPHILELYAAPRTPGNPVQSFDTDMFMLQGQLPPGDPDFDLLRIRAGTGFGLPSPGHTTLTRLPNGNWAVDSFFDITYEIEFVGAPGGPLSGMSGSTTGTIRTVGSPEPGTLVLLGTGALCLLACAWRQRRRGIRA